MSTADYTVARVVDSRINVRAPKVLVAADGPASTTFQQVLPPDPSSLNPVFTVQSPSVNSGISRTLRWTMRGSLTLTGANLNALQAQNAIAFRQYPLQQTLSAVNLQINDTTVSLGNLSSYIAALLRVGATSKSMAGQMTMNASPDLWCEYADAVGAQGPFQPAADGDYSNYADHSRTMGITAFTVAPGNASATITFEISEPLIIPPLAYGADSFDKALFGIHTLQATFTMANVHRMLSIALVGGATVASVALTPTYQALEVNFLTPRERSMVERPLEYTYSFAQVQAYYSNLTSGVLAAGAQVTGSSNVVEFPVIPSKLIVFATYSEIDRANAAQSLADCFFPIQAIQCQFGTKAGLLAGATQAQLWEMSARAGAALPYWCWAGMEQWGSSFTAPFARASGGPLVIDVSADLSLPDGLTPGMIQRISFNVTSVTVENQTSLNFTAPRLIVLAITDGILANKDGASAIMLGGVPGHDDERFKKAQMVETAELHAAGMDGGFGGAALGGSFWDFLKKAGRSLVKVAAPIVSAVAPELAPVAGIASQLVGGARMPSRLYQRASAKRQ